MNSSFERFTVRVIVFEKSDVFDALDQLIQSAKTMDLDVGSSAVMRMRYPRAARVEISPHTNPFPKPVKHLEPLMFHLTCMFSNRGELQELLEHTKQFVDMRTKEEGFKAGISGDVPGNSAPYGVWELTNIEAAQPRSFLFR